MIFLLALNFLPGRGRDERPEPPETRAMLPDSMASVGKRETCVTQKPDPRSAVSIGLDWGTRITTIGLEFALPAFLGFGLDRWWNTSPWMTLAGAFLGLAIGNDPRAPAGIQPPAGGGAEEGGSDPAPGRARRHGMMNLHATREPGSGSLSPAASPWISKPLRNCEQTWLSMDTTP